jgi:hypothetical protein
MSKQLAKFEDALTSATNKLGIEVVAPADKVSKRSQRKKKFAILSVALAASVAGLFFAAFKISAKN